MTQIELTESLNSYAKKLMEITATVKNYTDVTIDLEDLNREKALQAILSETYPRMSKESLDSYTNVLSMTLNNDLEQHILHLSYIYALTGYGQVYIDHINMEVERKYAKYLMYNNRAERKIVIKSTKDILNQLVFSQSSILENAFKSRYSKSKDRFEISLKIKQYFDKN